MFDCNTHFCYNRWPGHMTTSIRLVSLALCVVGSFPLVAQTAGASAGDDTRPIPSFEAFRNTPIAPQTKPSERGFDWGPLLAHSFRFLAAQHAFRFATEPGTRQELRGPFFRDYWTSIKDLNHWRDGDPFYVNYIGHPMMGSVSGYIARQNDPGYRGVTLGSPQYWKSVRRSLLFSTVYSTQFEIGPLGECSLGNVGKIPGTQGYVDLVVTPLLGTGWMIGEDALDKYVVQRIERATTNLFWRSVARSALNPSRTFANVLRGKWPWYRDDRGGIRQVWPPVPAAAGVSAAGSR
jgi:hypothetical protein